MKLRFPGRPKHTYGRKTPVVLPYLERILLVSIPHQFWDELLPFG